MAAPMKENTKNIFNYVHDHADEDITAADVAKALGLNSRQVNGSVTAFCRKGFMVREEAERTLADGTHEKVKYLRMTDAGMAFDPEAPVAEAK